MIQVYSWFNLFSQLQLCLFARALLSSLLYIAICGWLLLQIEIVYSLVSIIYNSLRNHIHHQTQSLPLFMSSFGIISWVNSLPKQLHLITPKLHHMLHFSHSPTFKSTILNVLEIKFIPNLLFPLIMSRLASRSVHFGHQFSHKANSPLYQNFKIEHLYILKDVKTLFEHRTNRNHTRTKLFLTNVAKDLLIHNLYTWLS